MRNPDTSERFDEARKKAIDQFVNTVKEFKCEEEATHYALMMISMGTKLVQGTKGSKFKKEFLQASIKDHSAIVFSDLESRKGTPANGNITA